jgi:glycosyltransferase involved in cell wall biosynthesis
MNDSVISIIIPTYNSEGEITACLNSIVSQTYPFIEVVVIDGLSTDTTTSLVRNISANYPYIDLISEKDNGIYDAMNKGVALAKGEWIYFLGSDDKLADSNVLRKVADAISINQCDFLYGNVKMVGEASWAGNGAIYDGSFTIEKLFTKNICHQAIFYKRELFQRLGVFNIEYKVCADWDFNHRCFASVKTCYHDLVVADFYAGGQSTKIVADEFTNIDFVINLRRYYKTSYFNKLFKNSSWIFFNLSVLRLGEERPVASFYFLLISLFHSNHKTSLIKNYIKRLVTRK